MATVGDTVWLFDEDRRVYATPEPGRIWGTGGPIYREHFVERRIVSEGPRSWVLDTGEKVNKQTRLTKRDHRGIAKALFLSLAEVEDSCYLKENHYRIADKVRTCRDAAVLRQIARLVAEPG